MSRLCCVTYIDSYSVDQDAYTDFLIGVEHKMVGCNSLSFSKSKKGDFVLINAKNKRDKKRYAMIVKIIDHLYEQIWEERGGNKWNYIFEFEAVTPVFIFENDIVDKVKEWCTEHSLNSNMLFNSRFCSKKFIPVVYKMIETLGH